MRLKFHRFALVLLLSLTINAFAEGKKDWPNTLSLTISGMESYEAGEPLYLLATLKNISDKPLSVVELSGDWAGAAILNFEIQGPKGIVPYTAGLAERRGWEGSISLLTLNPSEETTGEFNLTKHSDMAMPGAYQIGAIYYHTLEQGDIQEVRSPPIKLTLVEPKNETYQRLISESLSYQNQPIPIRIYDSDNSYFFETMGFEQKYLAAVKNFRGARLTKYLAFYLARYYYKNKRYLEAVNLLQPIESEPRFALSDDALLLLANCYLQLGQKENASEELSKILQNYPKGNCLKEANSLLKTIAK